MERALAHSEHHCHILVMRPPSVLQRHDLKYTGCYHIRMTTVDDSSLVSSENSWKCLFCADDYQNGQRCAILVEVVVLVRRMAGGYCGNHSIHSNSEVSVVAVTVMVPSLPDRKDSYYENSGIFQETCSATALSSHDYENDYPIRTWCVLFHIFFRSLLVVYGVVNMKYSVYVLGPNGRGGNGILRNCCHFLP